MSARKSHPRIEGLILRPFRPSDREQLVALNAYGLNAAGIDIDDDYYKAEDFADLEQTYTPEVGGCLVVGEMDGKIVAMGGIRRVDKTTCELLRMRVYPAYQGRGYGTAILLLLEEKAIGLGYTRIELLTGQYQRPAVDIYARHGYVVERQETLLGIPSVYMSKRLR